MSTNQDPSSPLYHPALDTSKLDDLADRSRAGHPKQGGKFDGKAGDAPKKLGRLGAWVRANAAQKKKLSEKWIADDAQAHADAKKKQEQEEQAHRERVELARGAISKGRK